MQVMRLVLCSVYGKGLINGRLLVLLFLSIDMIGVQRSGVRDSGRKLLREEQSQLGEVEEEDGRGFQVERIYMNRFVVYRFFNFYDISRFYQFRFVMCMSYVFFSEVRKLEGFIGFLVFSFRVVECVIVFIVFIIRVFSFARFVFGIIEFISLIVVGQWVLIGFQVLG